VSAMKATAIAHPNIALVKYWGKRDEALHLPHQSSLSMTLDGLSATTTVEFHAALHKDTARIDGRDLEGEELARIIRVLELIRGLSGNKEKARVASRTDFPKAAGLASSAAGGAALAAAASWAAGMRLEPYELSVIARRSSGSACRSIQGGFCEWRRGIALDGSDSFAVQIAQENHWPELRMVVVICAEEAKEISSREGMRHTVKTSPYYPAWIECAEADLREARAALLAKELPALGIVAERNAWRMHATAMAANPPIVYMKAITLAVIEKVAALRGDGVAAYFTLDAGPNPVVLCLADEAPRVAEWLGAVAGVVRTVVAGPGRGVEVSEDAVF